MQKQIRKFKGTMKFEYRIILPGNIIKTLEHIGRQQYNENGDIIRVIGTIRDVTEDRQVESELSEIKAEQAEIIENTDAGYFKSEW